MLKKITNFTPEEFESAEHPFSIKRLTAELTRLSKLWYVLSKPIDKSLKKILSGCSLDQKFRILEKLPSLLRLVIKFLLFTHFLRPNFFRNT